MDQVVGLLTSDGGQVHHLEYLDEVAQCLVNATPGAVALAQREMAAQRIRWMEDGLLELDDSSVEAQFFLVEQAEVEVDSGLLNSCPNHLLISSDCLLNLPPGLEVNRPADQSINLRLVKSRCYSGRCRYFPLFKDTLGEVGERLLTGDLDGAPTLLDDLGLWRRREFWGDGAGRFLHDRKRLRLLSGNLSLRFDGDRLSIAQVIEGSQHFRVVRGQFESVVTDLDGVLTLPLSLVDTRQGQTFPGSLTYLAMALVVLKQLHVSL